MGNVYKQLAIHDDNFTILSNEILYYKDENGKPLSLEALGLFLRLLSLGDNWDLNIRGLAKISGCGTEKISKLIDNLTKVGYVEAYIEHNELGQFVKSRYKINETLDKSLWKQAGSPYPENPYTGNPYMENPHTENQDNIKHVDNKENMDKEKKNNLTLSPKSGKSVSSFSHLIVKKEDVPCIHEPKQVISRDIMYPKEKTEGAGKKRGGKKGTKNVVQQKELEKGNEIRSVETQQYKRFRDVTSEDNVISQTIKLAMEARELGLRINQTNLNALSKAEKLKTHAATVIQDPQILVAWEDYIGMYNQKFHGMTIEAFNIKWQDLQQATNGDRDLIIQTLRNATSNEWKKLVVETSDNITVIPDSYSPDRLESEEDLSEDDYALATDENGKPLLF